MLLAAAVLGGCATRGPRGGPLPRFAEYAGREVEEVELVGNLLLPEDSLRAVLITRPPECRLLFLPICPFGLFRAEYELDLDALSRDVVRLQLAYRDEGYYGTRVLPAVDPTENNGVRVRFLIDPGQRVELRSLEVEGTEGIIPPGELRTDLPLEAGEPFRRIGFLNSAATVQGELLERGYAYAQVLRNYSLDTIADVADVRFVAVPGPRVTVDTILFLGGDRLGQTTARRQLAFGEGDVLRADELTQSQRNLYELGIVSFASVEIAPDSLQRDTAQASATVLVRLVEAPQYLVDASVGVGTLDCVRAQVRRLDRNFLGGARRLDLSASVSKIGVGEPLASGLENNFPCRALEEDRFSDTLNYRFAAEVEQPDLFGTRTSGLAGAFVERVSEVETYVRQAVGAQASLARQVGPQTLATTTFRVERGRTDADDVFFCVALNRCAGEEIEPLRNFRWSNSLGLAAVHDRIVVDQAVPVGGYQIRGGADWASGVLRSDDEYLRLLADGSVFRRVRTGWTLGVRLQGGTFLQGELGNPDQYIPPERRFYGGGPNSVRGFEQNALGPGAYVADLDELNPENPIEPGDSALIEEIEESEIARRSAIGGTRIVVGTVELQIPSPVLPQFLRLAGFVDAGQVWAEGDGFDTGGIRITPGAGVRLTTPVGPVRFDVGYNPYGLSPGPLFVFDSDQENPELRRVTESFRPDVSGFLDRLQFHIAVGQAF